MNQQADDVPGRRHEEPVPVNDHPTYAQPIDGEQWSWSVVAVASP
jgi:hypothetical protein